MQELSLVPSVKIKKRNKILSWDTPVTLTDLQNDFLSKFAQDLSPQLLLQSAEANRQWLSAEAANELIRLLYFQSLAPGKSIKIENNHIDTIQDISPEGSPSFTGLRISTLTGYLKATNGWVGIDIGAGVESEAYKYDFSFGDATPQIVAALALPSRVVQVSVVVTEPFDGVGASFTVGDAADHSRLLGAGEIDLTFLGMFFTSPGHLYFAPTNLNIYINPGVGASTGSGTVIIYTV